MKKVLTLFSALLFFGSMMVQAATTRIYCKMEYSWWTKDGARIGIILDSGSPTAMTLVDGSGNTWYADVDLGGHTTVTFRRIGSGNTDNWGAETTAQNIASNNVGTTNDFFTITNSSDTWSGNSQYCTGTWGKYVYTPPTIILKGGFNSWGDSDVFTDNGETATFVKTIAAGSYGMKITVGGEWKSYYTTIQRANSGTEYDFSENPTDATLVADIDGDYTFTYTYATKKLSVTFPEEPAVLPPATIQLHSNITNSSWESSANFVLAGNEETASLTLTDVAKGNYEFGVKINGSWTSNGSAFTRTNNSYVISGSSPNCTFNADRNGDYTFTWTYETNTLAVTYPAIPAQSVTFNSLASEILKGSVINLANCVTSSGIDEPTYRFYIKEKNGSYGDAINANYSFNANGEYVVKVEALEYGEPVAFDESNVVVYQSYTFTNGSTIYVDFSAVSGDVKGVNYPKVDQVGVDYDAAGAGTVKTLTFTTNVTWTTLAESFIKTEKDGWANQPFTVPGIDKNCVVVAEDGASYTWGTYVPAPPTIQLHSNFTNPDWETGDAFVVAGNKETASLSMNINQGNSYQFGVLVDGDWRANGSAFDRFNASYAIPAVNTGNCTFVADATGEYTFTWTYATNTLSVEYPEALSVALTGLNASQFVDDEVTVGATSNLTNVSYTYELKIGEGEYATLAANPYTFAAAGVYTFKVTATGDEGEISATKEVSVYEPLTLYFVNKEGWSDIHAYAYGAGDVKNHNWPGEAMTATGASTERNSYAVYSIVIASDLYTTAIFNNNNGSQTADMLINPAKPYYYNGEWYTTLAECDPIPVIKMHGDFLGDWGTTSAFTLAGNKETASLEMTINSKGTKNFGMRIGSDDNWTSNGAGITRVSASAEIVAGEGNCTLDVDAKGTYTFTWTYATNTLSVTYPIMPTQTVAFDGLASQILKGTEVTFAASSSGIDEPGYRFYVKAEGGDYGEAVASYEFNTNGNYVVKVEALENNTGDPVAFDEANVTVYETHTFTAGTRIYVDFSAITEGATGVNYPKANEVGVDWDGAGAGTVKTITFSTDVTWSTLAEAFIKTEKNGWANLPFTVPGDGKNCAVVAADGASYSWATRMPTIQLHSNFTNPDWETGDAFVVAGNKETASLSMNINQGNSYQFGVLVDGDWRANVSAFDRFNASSAIPAVKTGNCTFIADATGEYTFTWTYATNTLSVEYPEALSVVLTGLNASQLVDDVVTVGATSNLTNVSYAYELKIGEGEFNVLAENPYAFAATGVYTFKVTATGDEGVISATKDVTVYEPLTLYFVNKDDDWTNIHAYAYLDADNSIKNAEWAGEPMTNTGIESNHGHDVYSITIPNGRYDIIIFNNNNSGEGNQTANLTINAATPYYFDGAWYASLEEADPIVLTTDFYLVGNLMGWGSTDYRFMKATEDATEASTTVNITEYSEINLKIKEGEAWRGAVAENVTLNKDAYTVEISNGVDGNNIGMTPFASGDYIFTLNLTSHVLTVTYPDGEEMPIPTNIYLASEELNDWAASDPAYKFTVDGDVATLALTLNEEAVYKFKLVYNGAWYGADYNFKYYWCSDVALVYEGVASNLYTFKAGTYTFSYKISTGELSIAYPATSATDVVISEYEYATLYSATAFDVPEEVEAYIIPNVDGSTLAMERIYRIPANTGVLLHAPQGTYPFYEGDGRWMDVPASNLLKGSLANETINNSFVHYVLSYDNAYNVGFYWPYGTGAAQGVGSFENKAGKAYLEIGEQSSLVIARRGFPFHPSSSPTGLNEVESLRDAQKFIRNGQLFILRDGRIFNAQGVRVQ